MIIRQDFILCFLLTFVRSGFAIITCGGACHGCYRNCSSRIVSAQGIWAYGAFLYLPTLHLQLGVQSLRYASFADYKCQASSAKHCL